MLETQIWHLIDVESKEILRTYVGSENWVKRQTRFLMGTMLGSLKLIKGSW